MSLEVEVGKIVHNWVKSDKDFTAFDVTQEIRKIPAYQHEAHANVRHIVNVLYNAYYFLDMNYNRQVDMNISGMPFRYQKEN